MLLPCYCTIYHHSNGWRSKGMTGYFVACVLLITAPDVLMIIWYMIESVMSMESYSSTLIPSFDSLTCQHINTTHTLSLARTYNRDTRKENAGIKGLLLCQTFQIFKINLWLADITCIRNESLMKSLSHEIQCFAAKWKIVNGHFLYPLPDYENIRL